jgi:hypothetical protein
LRWAETKEGPWPLSERLFQPEETLDPNIRLYQGKAHPELAGADLVLTYEPDYIDDDATGADESLYYPRFVRVAFK